ncbi:methyltransferase type 11 [Dietzia sp. UCD-THP]|nr:methyltransferase type 11 [Dietzia sp. UCD-THP]
MESTEAGVRCEGGHAFDRARGGHLTLLGARGRRFPGDSVDQVAARERVLGHGVFDGVAEVLVEAAVEAVSKGFAGTVDSDDRPVVLDAGAGTGFYLDRVIDALRRTGPRSGAGSGASCGAGGDEAADAAGGPLGIGTELSVAAARRLARVNPLVAALVVDTWDGLPLEDGCVDVVQVVFAPRNPAEFARVLRPGGTLLVAVPGPGHLEPLRTRAGMLAPASDKAQLLDTRLAAGFDTGPVRVVDVTTAVPARIAADLALMGPSGVHLDRAGVEAAVGVGDAPLRVHVEVRSFRRSLQE